MFLRFSSVCSYRLKELQAGPTGKFSRHLTQRGYQPDGATLPRTSGTKTSHTVKHQFSRAPELQEYPRPEHFYSFKGKCCSLKSPSAAIPCFSVPEVDRTFCSGSKSVCLLDMAPQGKGLVGGGNVVIVQGMVNHFSRRVTDTPVLLEGLLEVSTLISHAQQGHHPPFFPSSSRYFSLCCIQSHGGGRHLNPRAFSRRAHGVKACGT